MLEKLNKKQIELQSVVRDEWIDIALHQQNFDKEELEAGVKWLYYASNLKEPKVTFVDGPKDFAKKFPHSVGDSVMASVRDSIRASVKDSIGDSVWNSVRDSIKNSVWNSVMASVRNSVWNSVKDSVRNSVRNSVIASVGDSVRDSVSWNSLAYDSDWSAWYEYYRKIKVVDQEKANKYVGFLRAGAFYCMFFEKVAFVMRRPIEIHQNERKQLHSTTRPAMKWKDGTEIYCLNGVSFEKKWWTKVVNDKFTPQEIFAIDNLEHRRIAYEFMDKTKMKKLKDYKVLDEVKDDGYGNKMKVISFTVKNIDEPLKYLNCFCPSTKREYFIGTNHDKCEEAKAQSFGFKSDEIEFIKEW